MNSGRVFIFIFLATVPRILFLLFGAHFLLLCLYKASAVPTTDENKSTLKSMS
tara:strand:+ start:32517 stop:32675 length:159 start_codon:yes stop_codon:yes gene_type:complete